MLVPNYVIKMKFPLKKQPKRAPLRGKKGTGKARAAAIFGEGSKDREEESEEDEQIASELEAQRWDYKYHVI